MQETLQVVPVAVHFFIVVVIQFAGIFQNVVLYGYI